MEVKELEGKIKAYLNKQQSEYFEGLELYAAHPAAKQHVVINMEQKWRVGTMHQKLIYELERILKVEKYSGKSAVLKVKPVNIPFGIFQETKEIAPEDFEYSTKYEDLPEELQRLVIEKGQLYNELAILKKELAAVGEVNDVLSVSKRQNLMKRMKFVSERIINIHWVVKTFDNSGEIDQDAFESLTLSKAPELKEETPEGENSEENDDTEEEPITEEMLEAEFKYKKNNYWQNKDLLKRLRSSVPRQEERAASTDKPELVEKNTEKARLGRKMIEVLEKWFEENKEPETNDSGKKQSKKK